MDNLSSSAFQVKPNFFIVGAAKCGTTMLYHYLRQHPEVFMPDKKEPHFFNKDLQSPNYYRDENSYLSLFQNQKKAKRVGEASVYYLYSKCAAYEIKKMCPDAKIIIMLRNPIDMLTSFHGQCLYSGNEDILDFKEAWDAEADRKKGKRIPKCRNVFPNELLYYREIASFDEQVERYLNVFGRNNVLVILYDDIVKNSGQVYRDVCAFLGIMEQIVDKMEIINAHKKMRSKYVHELIHYKFPIVRNLVKRMLSQEMRVMVKNYLSASNTLERPRLPLDPVMKSELVSYFSPMNQRLSKLLNRNLSHWMT